jgi:hypothetical protein
MRLTDHQTQTIRRLAREMAGGMLLPLVRFVLGENAPAAANRILAEIENRGLA